MQSYLKSIGGHFICMDITNYKTSKTPVFHTPNFRAELRNPDSVARDVSNPHACYVALYLPNHNIIDIDWKDDYVPSEEQSATMSALKSSFPWYPSATKKHGSHIIVPKDRLKNCPNGRPILKSLCDGDNIVEVLTSTPPILRFELFSNYQIPNTTMSPPMLDFYEFSPPQILKAVENRAVENRAVEPKEVTATDDKPHPEFRSLLSMLSPERAEKRETWLQAGFVGKLVNDFTAWDDWSKSCPEKYDASRNLSTWNSIPSSITIGLGTIHHWAKLDNYDSYMTWKFPYLAGKCEIETKGFAFLEDESMLIKNGKQITSADMKLACAPIEYFKCLCKIKGKYSMRSVFDEWLRDRDRKTWSSRAYWPYNPKEGNNCPEGVFNTATPMGFEYIADACDKDLDIVRELFSSICIEEHLPDYYLDWVAFKCQFPRKRPETAGIFKGGTQGAGKGSFLALLQRLWGDNVFATQNQGLAFGKHNTDIEDIFFCWFEEMDGAQAIKWKESFKAAITQQYNTINPKGLRSYPQTNYIGFMGASNNYTAVVEGRRFVQCQTNPLCPLDEVWFENWHKMLENQDAINRIGSALLNRVITCDIRVAPQTANKTQAFEKVIQPYHVLLHHLISGNCSPISHERDGNIIIPVGNFREIHKVITKIMYSKEEEANCYSRLKNCNLEYTGILEYNSNKYGQRRLVVIHKENMIKALKNNHLDCTEDYLEDNGVLILPNNSGIFN